MKIERGGYGLRRGGIRRSTPYAENGLNTCTVKATIGIG